MTRAVAFTAVLAAATAARADDVPAHSNTWIDAEVDLGAIETGGRPLQKLGLGLEVRQRLVAGLRLGVRGAVLRLVGGGGSPEMPDHRRGLALTAAVTADYVFLIRRWGTIAVTVSPEVGVGYTQIRGTGDVDGAYPSVYGGPRFGIEMFDPDPGSAPALLSARSWGAHLAFHAVETRGGDTSWQLVIGYDWGR